MEKNSILRALSNTLATRSNTVGGCFEGFLEALGVEVKYRLEQRFLLAASPAGRPTGQIPG